MVVGLVNYVYLHIYYAERTLVRSYDINFAIATNKPPALGRTTHKTNIPLEILKTSCTTTFQHEQDVLLKTPIYRRTRSSTAKQIVLQNHYPSLSNVLET